MHVKVLSHAAMIAAALGLVAPAAPAPAQTGAEPPPAASDAPDAGPAAAPPASSADAETRARIRFNFKGAPFSEVIDFFSRAAGLPVIAETDVPQGTLDYLSPESYTLDEALRVLNIILQSRGVMLRVDDDMLYLQKLEAMQRENVPTYVGEVPADIAGEQIITVVKPLSIALAKPVAEQLKSLVAEYGAITPLAEQNALVITETAAQIRRLMTIIEQIDLEDTDGVIEIFTIRHTRAETIMEPLKALLSERVEKYVINQQGQQVKLEEEQMSGLSITADPRTNSIVAKGTRPRIDKLRETIELLDVPASGGSRTIRTIALATMTAVGATERLNQVYQKLEEKERPAVLPLEDVNRVTIVGSEQAVAEGVALLQEIDGGGPLDGSSTSAAQMLVVTLQHADPQPLLAALKGLLNGRQAATTRLVQGPDAKSIILSGPAVDVQQIRQTISALDRPRQSDVRVRLLRLDGVPRGQIAGVVQRAVDLYDQESAGNGNATVQTQLDEAGGVLTCIGAEHAIERFSQLLRQIEGATTIQRETRQFQLAHATPGEVVAPLRAMAKQLLAPADGNAFVEPQIDAVDPLDLLIVTATPGQFSVLDSLIDTLDRPGPDDYQFRIVPLAGIAQIDALLARAEETFDALAQGHAEPPARPQAEFDERTGNLVLRGRTEGVRLYEQAVAQARQLLPPDRTGRMIELHEARAADVLEPLRDLLATTAPVDPARTVPEPQIEPIERTNALYVVAEPAQHEMIERLVRQLDTLEPRELAPLRLLQVRAADALQIASLLRDRYDKRPAEQRREQPVDIDADAATNTLIVTAHDTVFDEIRAFVDDVNESGETGAERETMLFPLSRARATDLAAALEKLYPEPPMPVDRRGRPLPHLQKPREVHVSAEPATNTLIIEAPVERRASFEALVEQLDRIQLPPMAQLRTYRIERGDPAEIARTLNDLARQGVMSAPAAEGGKAVDVSFTAEPRSRTLIVAGDEITFAKTEEVLADLKAVPVPRSLRIFDLAGADPQAIADRAQQIYAEQTADDPAAGEVSVEIDRDSASLLVVADDEAMIRFASILNQLQDTIAPPPDVRLIALEHADPAEVVAFLEEMASSDLTLMAGGYVSPPAFQPIDRTNSILVAAQPEQHEIIRSLIESLDVVGDQDVPPLRILQLRLADAGNIAQALMRQYDNRPHEQRVLKPVSITADPQTNALMVAAHPDVFPEIEAVVQELNRSDRTDLEGREIRIFPLKVARAEELAKTIDEMYPPPPMPVDRRGRPLPHLQEPREIVVRADPQTNSLIVDAPVQRMAGFENLVEQLDRQQITADTEVRTYRVAHAELDSLAGTLRELASAGALNTSGRDRRVPVTITTEPVSNTLVISGPVEAFERVEGVLADLDVKRDGPATSLRFFRLEAARADSVAPMLREVLLMRLAEDVPEAGTGGADVASLLNVTADPKTNTLIISAPEAIMPVAEQLVEQLDSSSAAIGEPTIRVRPLTFADAQEVSRSLTQALPQTMSEATGEPLDVKIIAAPGSNAVILVGIEPDLKEVEALIEPLDARPAMDAIDAKTFRLAHADAAEIASIVENLLTDQQASDPWILRERIRRSRGQIDLTPKIRVEADVRTNALIVSGPQRTVALAEALIAQLDAHDDASQRTYATFTPTNARPEALAQTAKRVIDSTTPAGRRASVELITEPTSGAIVVIGPQPETQRALDLLKEWDAQAVTPPQIDLRVIALQHTDPATVASVVGPMLADASRWPQELRALARAGRTVARPTVTPDADRNRVLVSAPSPLMPAAAEMIAQLDQPQGDSRDVRIVNLTQAQAEPVARAVREALPASTNVTVAAEPSSNSIIVTAPPGRLDEVDAIIARLDSGVAADQAQVRTVFLSHARAENIAPIVEDLLGVEQLVSVQDIPGWARWQYALQQQQRGGQTPDVRVVADRRLNAVVLAAPPAVLNIAEQMVAQLDVDPADVDGSTQRSVRVLTIDNADAAELAANLQTLFSEAGDGEIAPSIRVDTASNSLLVRATATQFRTIERVAGEIDRATIATSRQMRMVPIDPSRASAAEVAESLQRVLQRSRGSSVEVMTLEELLQRREGETGSEPAPPADASSMLNEPRPSGSGHAPTSVADRSLTVAARQHVVDARAPTSRARQKAGWAHVTRWGSAAVPAARVDRVVRAGGTPALPTIAAHANALPLVRGAGGGLGRGLGAAGSSFAPHSPNPSLRGRGVTSALVRALMIAAIGATPQDDDAADADFTIAVDDATNALIFFGSPRAIERAAALAEQLQSQLPAEPGTVRSITLPESIDARRVRTLIDGALRQMTPPGGQRGDFRRRVSILDDPANNALVVVASDRDFQTVADLIAAVSQPPPAESMIVKVYPLTTVTAERAAASVEALLDPDATGRRGRRNRQAERMRRIAVTLLDGDESVEGVFDPARVSVTSDAQTNALIVMAPAESMELLDGFVAMLDQSPVAEQATLKVYPLQFAQATELRRTLRDLFRSRFQSLRRQGAAGAIEPEFIADERTNTLLVTAAPEQLREVDDLLAQLDQKLAGDLHALRIIELHAARPSRAADLLQQAIIGTDQARRKSTQIIPDDNSGLLLVRAPDDVVAEIDAVLSEIDRDATSQFPVRTITLERADAAAVAAALQKFFDDRARIAGEGRGRRAQSRRVSIVGDPNSKTLLIAASDDDYAEIETLVEQFDTTDAAGALDFRVFQLRHAEAAEIEQTVQNLVSDLFWNQTGGFIWFGGGRSSMDNQRDRGTVAVRADRRLNALIVTGQGDKFDVVEKIIDVLDAPPGGDQQRLVRLYRMSNADLNLVRDIIDQTFGDADAQRRWWEPADPTAVRVQVDERSRTLIVSATAAEQDEIADLIADLDQRMAPDDQQTQVLAIEYGQAEELAQTLGRFLDDRSRHVSGSPSTATIMASRSANSLIVSAARDDLATVRDLLTKLDQPDVSGGRTIEIVALKDGDAEEIARIVREQFSRRGGQGVIVTADLRSNALIINAPAEQFAQAESLIRRLDTKPAAEETIIRTYALEGARADEAVRILSDTLQLDSRGEASGISIKRSPDEEAVQINARIVADRRSNSLIVTATEESLPIIEDLIAELDDVPAVNPVEFRIVNLEHAIAADVAFALGEIARSDTIGEPRPRIDYNRLENQLIIAATADQFDQFDQIIDQIDQPAQRQRVTDFVALEYAQAESVQEALSVFYGPYAVEADTPEKLNVRIVADRATNSLVISAEESEWPGITSLLEKLDSEEYDASLQLKVIPLTYADASSVAQAINDAFQANVQRRGGDERSGRDRPRDDERGDRRDLEAPAVLVESDEWVRASAEPLTNSVVVSAARQTIRKIEDIVAQLDVADYAKLPAPRLIPVREGDIARVVEALSAMYEREGQRRRGPQSVRIIGAPDAGVIIVRAAEEEFAQIRTLAEALQQQAAAQGVGVHVVALQSAPAARVASAITDAFSTRADQLNQPLSVQVDAMGNNLIVACSATLLDDIRATVEQLDALSPAAGQAIFIIELEHISPDAAQNTIETIGLTQPQPADSVSRLVTEPITVAPLIGRNALAIVANPADRETIVGFLKALDAEPALAESQMRIVHLQHAEAGALAQLLGQVFAPGEQQADTPLARAVQEQVRRLALRRDGANEPDVALDLTQPIRIIPDATSNAVIVASTPANVAAVEALIGTLDTLPITDAVTVQLFPLQNIAADQFATIVNELFEQGKQLGDVPSTNLQGLPGGMVGEALLHEIAVSVDGRTNTVIVAGTEDAVALVEVLRSRLDSDIAAGWVEPRIVQLRFADAVDLADTLHAILVDGAQNLPQSTPIQRQIGRLRMARTDRNGGKVLEADVFTPMTRLVIRPHEQLNALILVGTPGNLEVVTELVGMLDIEAASPSAAVRIYPVEHASAARLARTLRELFEQQVQSKAIRPEDRVIVQADDRTNALIVSTSPRSFAVLESLLAGLDAEIAPDLREIRRIELTSASATRLASLIQELMDARLERLQQIQPETAELERATIVADARTNSLLVAAGIESFDVVKRLAEDLDGSTLDDSLVRVISVSKANVDRLAETITALMDRRYAELADDLRAGQMPLVLTDPRSNALLVAANQADLAAIKDLVERLDAAPVNPAVGLHVVSVDPAVRADSLTDRLQRLMEQRRQSLGEAETPSDRVRIEADAATNSLVIACSEENLEVIRGLITVLSDSSRGSEFEVEVISLAASRATEMIDLLEDLYVNEANETRGDDVVRVTADERLNAVLVSAPPADVEAIRGLVSRLDGARPATVLETKFISLQSANALETVSLIENIFSGRGIGSGRRSQQSTVLKYIRQIASEQGGEPQDAEAFITETELGQSIRDSITLTPDLRTNTIIVRAPASTMTVIERMIRDLDATSVGAQNLRIFTLTNADAIAMAEIITDLFNLSQQGNLYVLKPREDAAAADLAPGTDLPGTAPIVGGLTGTDLTAVPDERQQLSITVDSRTNSLLVSGTPAYLDLVEQVVDELDRKEANERETHIYPLRNAEAAEVASVITNFVDAEQRKLIETLGSDQIGSAARLLEREVTIVGDEASNTVLVSASPRYMDRVKQMISELDVDPPQVLIQVLLAEVTLDSSEDFGVDFLAEGEVGSVSVSGAFGLASALTTGIGAFTPSVSVTGSDFDLLIRALAAQGRLQVLSNPMITAANNVPARLQVGEEIRVPTGVGFDFGSQFSETEEKQIGIILEVTPSINPDGFVRMEIEPEISELSARTVQISENFQSPVITKRIAQTVVTVKDGQTVVVGGLISDRYERRDRKVPVLGDLPFVGGLFRSEEEDQAKTELLIVLTPYVVTSPAELDAITDVQVDRLSVPPPIKRQIREGQVDGMLIDEDGRPVGPLNDEGHH